MKGQGLAMGTKGYFKDQKYGRRGEHLYLHIIGTTHKLLFIVSDLYIPFPSVFYSMRLLLVCMMINSRLFDTSRRLYTKIQ